MSVEDVETRIQQLQPKAGADLLSELVAFDNMTGISVHVSCSMVLQVEADEQKLMRLQTGSDLIPPAERQKVEAVRLSAHVHERAARCSDVEVQIYVKLASVALSCCLLPLQVFASNMEHWQKRRKIFKSIWWVMCKQLCFALLADASHAAKFMFP